MTVEFDQLRVIVVEDDVSQRQLAVRYLTRLGVNTVVEAGDGAEALEKIRSAASPFDIAICDLSMPGMDGVQFIRHMASDHLVHSLILLSGMASPLIATVETMARSHGLTVLGAIEKPVTEQKLDNYLVKYRPGGRARHAPLPQVSHDEIEDGMAAGQFVAYYQPKVDFNTLKVCGFEALARWNHPALGLTGPGAFISAAEQSGAIHALTEYMLDLAFNQVRTWSGAGLETGVAVNLSVAYLGDTGAAGAIAALAQRSGVPPQQITLEVTESLFAANLAAVLENVARLRMMGFHISLDDFGTGFASVQQLMRVPFTELKIDQSFINGAATRPSLRTILESCLHLAGKLKLQSVAEGIERDEEWQLLKSLGCNIAQGYLIARPMPAEVVPEWHQSWVTGH